MVTFGVVYIILISCIISIVQLKQVVLAQVFLQILNLAAKLTWLHKMDSRDTKCLDLFMGYAPPELTHRQELVNEFSAFVLEQRDPLNLLSLDFIQNYVGKVWRQFCDEIVLTGDTFDPDRIL